MIYNLIVYFDTWLASVGLLKYLQVFYQTTFRGVAAVIVAFFTVLILGKPVIRWLVRQKIGDAPEFYRADLNRLMRNKEHTPTMGGILIFIAIMTAVVLLADLRVFYVRMALICLVLYAGLGAIDDWLKLTTARRGPGGRDGLRSWEKLCFQVGWALLLGFFIHHHGQIVHMQGDYAHVPNMTHILNLPFQRTLDPHVVTGMKMNPNVITLGTWTFGILAVCVIAGSSNAVNLTDGMDGLAGGVMSIVAFAFMLLCFFAGIESWSKTLLVPYVPESDELAIVAGAMMGACIGFLWFNCSPAMVFMGDTGSLALGGLLGFVAVVVRQEVLLVLIGGVFVIEALSVILQVGFFKLSGGRRIFRCAPIHHHFNLGGWPENRVVVRFWLVTALLAALALATVKLR